MRSKLLARLTLGIVLAGVFACGDVGAVRVELDFPDEETELRTRAVLFQAREAPVVGDGCDALWPGPGPVAGLRESRALVQYPNRTDIQALGIDLAPFDSLTLLVYAYASLDVENAALLAGGCQLAPVSGDSTSSVRISLERRP